MNRLVLGMMWVVMGVVSLSCETLPDAPRLYQPLDGAKITHPTFVWEAIGDEYELQISQEIMFTTIYDVGGVITDTAFTYPYPDILKDNTYFWRVRAYKDNWGEWSEVRSFTIDMIHNSF
ncbi:hypothetical protein JXM67_07060 [candidate division WOR-3 bacterium]|nr:hypothetical protein [candidate division WOR-3 bacterium]